MLFELNFTTKKGLDGIRKCYFFQKDLMDFKECCPACVTDVSVNNDTGSLFVTVDDKIFVNTINDAYDLAQIFRALITEKETNGYISWFKVTTADDVERSE